jgi:RHS repeat-associated protein
VNILLWRDIQLPGVPAPYTNDENGNTLFGGGRTMTWDSQNRMASCVTGVGASQKTSTFTYGTDGLRRSMVVAPNNGNPTVTTKYILDGQNVVQEIATTSNNSNPVIAATYLSGPNGPIYRRPTNSADVRWYVYDGGGNVVGEVDQLGSLTGSKKHDVYGATRNSSGSVTSKQGWQGGVGHQSDEETGLVYMRARYYAREIGRFQSEDPAKDGMNWFVYCNTDPINKIDADGKTSGWKFIGSPEFWAFIDWFIASSSKAVAAAELTALAAWLRGLEKVQLDLAAYWTGKEVEYLSRGLRHAQAWAGNNAKKHMASSVLCATTARMLECMAQDLLGEKDLDMTGIGKFLE